MIHLSKRSDIVIISDAWYPQINGVVRTLDMMRKQLLKQGRQVEMITPDQFCTMPCPTYPEIRLSLNAWPHVARRLEALKPIHIHIATEGPLGLAARSYCRKHRLGYTTAYHTRFPEYIYARCHLPLYVSYGWLKRFHARSHHVLVPTPSVQRELEKQGFTNTQIWPRGVDTSQFYPLQPEDAPLPYPRPIWLNVGRISVEKNIEAFLRMELPGTKIVVGDGPQREALQKAYPDVIFAGVQKGEALRRYYAGSDVFVFPSKTDTFGLVMLEALACGTPVAAYPVPGPIDVIHDVRVGSLQQDLEVAARQALELSGNDCVQYVQQFSWTHCANLFADYLYVNVPHQPSGSMPAKEALLETQP